MTTERRVGGVPVSKRRVLASWSGAPMSTTELVPATDVNRRAHARQSEKDAVGRAQYYIRFGEYQRAIEALAYALTQAAFVDGMNAR